MLSVEELPRFPGDDVVYEEDNAIRSFDPAIESALAQGKASRVKLEPHTVGGHPVPKILEFIERECCDLLVIGFMGHSALYNRLIGSTTDRLVDLSPCAVLVVK